MPSTTPSPRIGRSEWAEAALAALSEAGPSGVSVEGVARRLGVTKGSFYWHFGGREELLSAALDRWQQVHTTALIEASNLAGNARMRLETLFRAVAVSPVSAGELALYAGTGDPLVANAVLAVTKARTAYVADLLSNIGFDPVEARERADLALAMVIGQRTLAAALPDRVIDEASALAHADLALALLTAPLPN